MHSLDVMRKACWEALDDEGDGTGEDLFRAVVDPQSVLELVDLAEGALPRQEVIALGALLHDLVIQLGRAPSTPERDALLAIARERFGHIWI
jgi:hypothetical protein